MVKHMKLKSKINFWSLLLIVAMGSLSATESLWWHKARQSYPRTLVSAPPSNANDLASLWKACGSPLEIEPEGGEMALVRCGTFWPMRSIWLVPKAQIAPALQ